MPQEKYGSVKNYMLQRTKDFNKYGYRVIFIRQEEITDKNWEQVCLNKINKGVENFT